MTIRSIKLRDERYGEQWFEEIEDRWEYADCKADPRWRRGWISMEGLRPVRRGRRVQVVGELDTALHGSSSTLGMSVDSS